MRTVIGVALLCIGLARGQARADVAADLAAAKSAAPACDAARAHCFGLAVHVVSADAGLVVSADWIAGQVAAANKHFAPIDVGFTIASIDALPAGDAHIENRAQRNALAAGGLPGSVVHVFFIDKLENVDEPGAPVFGVTWHRPGAARKYVIIGANARERTLAHELGHVFGLPHSEYAISIMNKTPREVPPQDERRFADEEIADLRRGLARLLRDKVLSDVTRTP